mmetsp:Transcript_4005/g.6698  ORF Transcript_4005/g.6698 Transcript_4005/m.6698 type:complete len:785 (-) Transcript_4005:21-2375(-)
MGNTQGASSAASSSGSRETAHLSDREMARQLIDQNKKRVASQRSVQFQDSVGSEHSTGIMDSSPSLKAKGLRSNLMREQKDRDPLFYYEIMKVVGVGSMGSVAMVRKRDDVIGGSARKELVLSFRRQKRNNDCFKIPVVGGLFKFCMEAKDGDEPGGSRHGGASRRGDLLQSKESEMSVATANGSNEQVSVLYALKSIHLNRVTDTVFIEELENEIEILKRLDHPHIVRPIETFVHRNQLYIVMELCSGGDLYSRDPYTEEEAARIVSSILSAVGYMHSRKVVHRDLKYENILFVNDSPHAEIKLIDFGLSKKYASDKELTEGVGTIYTMAPEVLKGTYSYQADLWSIGVITYMLLSSQMPFYGRKRSHIVEQIMQCKYDFKGRRWKRVSPQAKAIVEDLLVGDPDDRATAEQIMQSTWLNKRFTATTRGPTLDEIDTTAGTMKKYASYSHLKKLALMVIAHKSTSAEIGILRKVFQTYDKRKDGTIRLPAFREALAKYGYPEEEIKSMFEAVDLDGTGKIRYTEFLASTIEAHGAINEQRLAEAFDRLDSDDSGFISADNLREILGPQFPQERIDSIIKEADLTEDNRISYPEFLALWEDKAEIEREEMYMSIREPEKVCAVASKETAEQRNLMRADSDAESTTMARANYIEGKAHSERRMKETAEIVPNAATKIVLNTVDEIVEDPEVISESFGGSSGSIGPFEDVGLPIDAVIIENLNEKPQLEMESAAAEETAPKMEMERTDSNPGKLEDREFEVPISPTKLEAREMEVPISPNVQAANI